MAFAENLRKAREEKGYSQNELAKMAHISQPSVANFEIGKILPTIITGVDLARALGTTCEQLVRGEVHE